VLLGFGWTTIIAGPRPGRGTVCIASVPWTHEGPPALCLRALCVRGVVVEMGES